MFSLLKYAKKYKIQIILGPFFKFLEAVFELLLPIFMAKLIDEGINNKDIDTTIKMAVAMFVMTLIGLFCVLICQYFSSIASQGFGTELRNEMMKKINSFSHIEINKYGTSTLITRTTNDINQLQLALAMLIRLVVRAPFLSIGSIVMAFIINPKIAWIFVITLPLFSILLFFIMKKTVPLYKRVQEKLDSLNLVVNENLSGVRVIRAFAKKDEESKKVGSVTDDLALSYKTVANISALLNPVTTLIMNSAIIFLLYIGGKQVNIGGMKQGEVLALINYMTQMLLALIVVANLVVIFTRAFASAHRVNEIFNTEPSVTNLVGQSASWKKEDEILNFSNVAFKYTEKSGYALKDINFVLKQGESLGIIGPTGSGKSALIQLIPRFYNINKGNLKINNKDIEDYTLEVLRDHIGVVPQNSVLFTGTIRSNLLWGKENASDDECWKALEIAQCADFVKSLPEGLDYKVLAGGKNFSGGQRQRITIARALIKNPDILILDDSLSALDYKTDLNLRNALNKYMHETTFVIVSQRISSVRSADKILVLNDGKQDGFNNHENLLQTSKTYEAIAKSQIEKEEL
ncbi:MAG: ABC transporter ATP-binding protein [Miniphocaeibacter sp.]|uniref:ABC transporter ATP-binding protein n=1 Tax=Miniphocaeibacter sp. TaxID=3100973 RepID=UPI001852477B|nr:ABC transporter ATP-binding protein [Gallicola sp.]